MTQVVIGAACMTQEALHSPVLLRAGSQRRKPCRSGRSTGRSTGRSCSVCLRPPPGLSWPDIHAISSMRVLSMPWFGEGAQQQLLMQLMQLQQQQQQQQPQ